MSANNAKKASGGIKLYKDKGEDPQTLAGHSTEKMTKNYDSGHADIRWMAVKSL